MPDGQRILSGARDGTVRVWRVDGTLENTFSSCTPTWVCALVALPDSQHALSGSARQDRQALQRQRRRRPAHLQAPHTRGVSCLALLPDGLRFVSGSDDDCCVASAERARARASVTRGEFPSRPRRPGSAP